MSHNKKWREGVYEVQTTFRFRIRKHRMVSHVSKVETVWRRVWS